MIQEFVTNPLQKVDFKYNTRGWLKEINDINTSVQSSGNSDLFSFKLNYNTVENADGYTGTSLYNGNISETYWRSSSDAVLRKYGYQYDNLNRMTNSIYQKPENAVIVTNSYNESLAYDKNGNITALQRYGALDDAIYPVLMDDLVYTYNITGNKPNNLINVADNTNDISGFMDGTNTDADYSYDDNGNMIVDKNKNINSITYNHLNLPIRILFGNGNTIEYLYNAIGQKLNKIVREGAVSTKTEYLSGFQYKNEVLKFFSHAEGYVNYIPASGRGTVEAFNYAFNYTDHLGNIRLTYGIDPTTNVLKIMEENHYYPFGLKHTNYNTQYNVFSRNEEDQVRIAYVPPVESFYKYKYNGKELQDELGLNIYDYGNRNYDAALGRFMNMDRFSEKYVDTSPYHYTKNNPVFYIDIKGDSLAVFRPNGSFWKIQDDGKKEWSGRYYQKSKVISTDEKSTVYEYSDALNFEFADPENDSKAIKDGTINQLLIVDDKKIGDMLGAAGALDPKNKENSWSYISKESIGGGRLDFSVTSIDQNFPGASASEFGRYTPYLFLPKGETMAHNHFNFGNFLWAAAGDALGFSMTTLCAAAHYNSVANSGTNGYPGQLDSQDDQKSIIAGSNYSSEHQFSSRTWNSSTGISPIPTKR